MVKMYTILVYVFHIILPIQNIQHFGNFIHQLGHDYNIYKRIYKAKGTLLSVKKHSETEMVITL